MFCIFKSFNKKDEDIPQTEEEQLLKEVFKAHEEWQLSMLHFNEATDPKVIEYVTYQVKAAEKKYTYLLNLYKDKYHSLEIENLNIPTN